MDFGISGKVAMVAAGSKGIGLATAQQLLNEGCRVSICGRTEATLETALGELGSQARAFRCDVSKPDDLARWVGDTEEHLGAPEILVTNTGGPPAGAWTEMSDEQWQAGFDSTLLNVVRLMRLVTPGMRERGWGRVVHVTSLVAKEPSALLPISSTLRTGLMSLTRLQAVELAASGVTVNAVLPGHTLTDRQRHLADLRAGKLGILPSDALQMQAEEVPAKRLGRPEEIGAAIAFLCSQQAAYITGVNLLVDGGLVRAPA